MIYNISYYIYAIPINIKELLKLDDNINYI